MPEGTILCIGSGLVITVSVGMVAYCLRLARTYRLVERDRQCLYEGVVHHVIDIIFDRNDWFMRKVRIHRDTFPYCEEVLIADVHPVKKGACTENNAQGKA